jgi:hypothetical protein
MDYNYLENCIREEIKRKCPQLPQEIIEEYLNFTFFCANWVKYGDNQSLYILGIAQGKYDFYYFGCDDNYDIKLISCALEIKKDKERENDYIPKFDTNFKKWCKDSNQIWKLIRKNIKDYFKNNKQDKLLYFQDHILSDEHVVYDNEEHTEYHIEKLNE